MKTILVAEDNLVNRELLREILETGEYQVVEQRTDRKLWPKLKRLSRTWSLWTAGETVCLVTICDYAFKDTYRRG